MSALWVMSRHRINVRVMSVILLKADIHQRGVHVRLVPLAFADNKVDLQQDRGPCEIFAC
jgi:hypothetical protein